MEGKKRAVKEWIDVQGRWKFEHGNPIYLGPTGDTENLSVRLPYGLCVTDPLMSEGDIRGSVEFSGDAEGRFVFGYRSERERYISAGLGGYGFAYTITEYDPSFGWRGLAVAGSQANLTRNQKYRLEIKLRGQRVSLRVNQIRVFDYVLDQPLPLGQVGVFSWGRQEVRFSDIQVRLVPPKVFVVMKFSEPYNQLYSDVIQPVVSTFGLQAYHVGEVYGPSVILNDIQQGIIDSKIVIAEITPINENVFYELGFAHALKKPTILLAERGKQLPFDISGYRVLFYENSIGGKKLVEDTLRKH